MSTTVREATEEEIAELITVLDAYEPVMEIRVFGTRLKSKTVRTEVWPIITLASL